MPWTDSSTLEMRWFQLVPLGQILGIILYFSVIVVSRFFKVVMANVFPSFQITSMGDVNQILTSTL